MTDDALVCVVFFSPLFFCQNKIQKVKKSNELFSYIKKNRRKYQYKKEKVHRFIEKYEYLTAMD
jgi:hypothetical protein